MRNNTSRSFYEQILLIHISWILTHQHRHYISIPVYQLTSSWKYWFQQEKLPWLFYANSNLQLSVTVSWVTYHWVVKALFYGCGCSSDFFIVWLSSWSLLLGHTRSQGRCWAAFWPACHPEPSGHVFHREFDGLGSGKQHGQQSVLLHHTCKQQKRPYHIRVSRRHQSGGSWAEPTLFLARPFQKCECQCRGWNCGVS